MPITITLPDGSTPRLRRRRHRGRRRGVDRPGPGQGRARRPRWSTATWYDLDRPIGHDARVAIVTPDSDDGREVLRHSTAHVMAQAVTDLFPGAKYAIGPAIADGFYYDFELPDGAHFSDDDLERIEARMREIVKADEPFVREELDREHAIATVRRPALQDRDHRAGRSRGLRRDRRRQRHLRVPQPAADRTAREFVDLCRGPHVPSTKRLGAFKLTKVAGAYWRGDEKRPMLQRIYGTAWESKAALEEHLHRLEEAEKRDHRKLGAELDLFSFPDEIGSGLAVFHPKGGTIRRVMEDYSRQRHEEAGYEFVNSPHITKSNLFEISGPPRLVRRRHVPADGARRRHRLLPQADELPVPHPDLPQPHALVPRAAAAALRVRHGVPLREVGRRARPHPRPRHDPGRRAHLLHARADRPRAHARARVRPQRAARLRPRRLLPRAVHQARGQGGRHRRGVGGGDRGVARRSPRPTTSSW